MALRIKLARGGSAHNPVYRIVVGEARTKRDGKFVEWIGTYSPKAARGQLKVKLDRVDYWVGVGAKPTDTVRSLINKARRTPAEELDAPEAKEEAPAPVVEETPVAEEAPAVEEAPVAEEAAPVEEAEAPAAEVEEAPAAEEAAKEEAPAAEAEESTEAVAEEEPAAEEAPAEEEKAEEAPEAAEEAPAEKSDDEEEKKKDA